MNKYFDGSGTIGFTCDNCGRETQGYTWVNGMKFCAKCYQETFGNNTSKFVDLLNAEMYELKISNLKHKLEEKDQRIAELEEQLKNAIVPKFKIGQEVWLIRGKDNRRIDKCKVYGFVNNQCVRLRTSNRGHITRDLTNIFIIKEEAQVKLLKELQSKTDRLFKYNKYTIFD